MNDRISCLVKGGLSALLAMAAISFAIGAAAQAPQQGKPTGDAAEGNATRGKELYVKNACYQCHGYAGQGGSSSGVRIAPDPLPWQAIAAYIRKPAGAMPPFTSKLLSDQDVQDIYAFLKSVPGPVDIKNIPTFSK